MATSSSLGLGILTERPTAYPSQAANLLALEWVAEEQTDILIITFNRPEQRNPIDKHTICALRSLLADFEENGGPRGIVITGAGRSFSAGGDLRGYQNLYRDPVEFRAFMDDFDAACAALEASPAVVVAMINGVCVAGGLEIALACDIIVIADEARIGDGHLGFAQLPGAGGSQRLVRAIGLQRARHWLLSGELFPAAAAVESGLAIFQAPLSELRNQNPRPGPSDDPAHAPGLSENEATNPDRQQQRFKRRSPTRNRSGSRIRDPVSRRD